MVKHFLYRFFIFLSIPLLVIIVIEVALPPTLFTFRGYEALIFNYNIPHLGCFYPNSKIYKEAEGDMCHHTSAAVIKKELWITDSIGFRNDCFVKKPDVVFIGNSFIYGTGLTQNEIISNQVKRYMNNKVTVYNMAEASLGDFDYYLRTGIIEKPKLIIYAVGEIHVPSGYIPYEKTSKSTVKNFFKPIFYFGFNSLIDKSIRFYSLKWIKARINGVKHFGTQTPLGGRMFFAQGANAKKMNNYEIKQSANAIISCQKYCDSLGIKFLYLPTPNKETIYYDLIPFDHQPDYYFQLASLLHQSHIEGINTLDLFNNYRKKNNQLIYHLDDTHWNSIGVSIVSTEIANYIRKIGIVE